MSAIIQGIKFATKITNKNPGAVFQLTRNHGWNKDYKPGKYPVTEEERRAAAKKYNLHPDEYEPIPDDGEGAGDYPKLPDIPVESKDPYYPYDFPETKRNFGEPLHADHDFYSEDRWGYADTPRYTPGVQLLAFLTVMGAFTGAYLWLDDKRGFRPAIPKQLPGPGKVHYTFEPK